MRLPPRAFHVALIALFLWNTILSIALWRQNDSLDAITLAASQLAKAEGVLMLKYAELRETTDTMSREYNKGFAVLYKLIAMEHHNHITKSHLNALADKLEWETLELQKNPIKIVP